MNTVKIKKSEALALYGTLENLANKETPLSWPVARTLHSMGKQLKEEYHDQLQLLIKTHAANLDAMGNPVPKSGTMGTNISHFDYKEQDKFVEDYRKLMAEEIELKYYPATDEQREQYIATNPVPAEYIVLIGTVIPEPADA